MVGGWCSYDYAIWLNSQPVSTCSHNQWRFINGPLLSSLATLKKWQLQKRWENFIRSVWSNWMAVFSFPLDGILLKWRILYRIFSVIWYYSSIMTLLHFKPTYLFMLPNSAVCNNRQSGVFYTTIFFVSSFSRHTDYKYLFPLSKKVTN